MINGQTKGRRLTVAEKRAQSWIAMCEQRALKATKQTKTAPGLGALTVRRNVLGSTERGIFQQTALLDLLSGDHGADVFSTIGTSLMSPLEGKRSIDPWKDNLGEIKQRLETITETFPTTLSGFIGSAVITGSSYNEIGPQFVGYTFDIATSNTLTNERKQLAKEMGSDHFRFRATPHISLFRTTDHELAKELKAQLYDMRSSRIPVELGPAEVIPIDSTSHLPKSW